jgi:hypothetical protein
MARYEVLQIVGWGEAQAGILHAINGGQGIEEGCEKVIVKHSLACCLSELQENAEGPGRAVFVPVIFIVASFWLPVE